MASFLLQQRAISFVGGVGAATALYLSTKRKIWSDAAAAVDQMPGAPPRAPSKPEVVPLFGPAARGYVVRRWNESVDAAFRPVVASLAERKL